MVSFEHYVAKCNPYWHSSIAVAGNLHGYIQAVPEITPYLV